MFREDLRENLFIKIPKGYFEEGCWGKLPRASQAIYPVIRKHANAQGSCFPSELTISKFAGVTEKTVRKGLKGLDGFPGFKQEKYITSRGRTGYRYMFEPVAKEEKAISISHAFFNGGNWSRLTPCAKAIYPVLKCFWWWGYHIYSEDEEIDLENEEFVSPENPFLLRKYDFTYPDKENVAQLAGINIRSINNAYQSLSDEDFIEYHGIIEDRETWRLFINPPQLFNDDDWDDPQI